jgi:hypothetical protein
MGSGVGGMNGTVLKDFPHNSNGDKFKCPPENHQYMTNAVNGLN